MDRRLFLTGAMAGLALSACERSSIDQALLPDLPADITDMSASHLSRAIRQRQVSCREVMESYLSHIGRYNPVYNAIISQRDADTVLAEADQADAELARGEYRGWMHGMPHAVKDLANVKGMVTTMGYPGMVDNIAAEDSYVVDKMRRAGAIFIGKTNTPEFGMGSQTYNPLFGATGSAWNPDMTAGGSSGGAACGLGTHMLPVADGGDMMGSLRNPGAFNNVIGFRPSFGRISEGGSGDLYYLQLPVSGPMGRNVEDTIRLFSTLAGQDSAEPLSLRDPLPGPETYKARPLNKMRIGWLGNYDGYLPMEDGILDLCQSSLKTLQSHGAQVEPCQPDYDMSRLWQTWLTLRHWRRNTMRGLYDNPQTRALLKPEAVFEIEGSLNQSGRDIHLAGIARSDWFRALHKLFETYDYLALPTAQVFPFPKDIHWPKSIANHPMDTYHRWMEVVIGGSLGGLPVLNVPVGFNAAGLPMGMQIMGPQGADLSVLEFGLAYEQVTDFLTRRPELIAAR